MKKGQGGMNAAVLVAIILGLIILYVVFLPTSEREKVFYNKTLNNYGSGDNDDDEGERLLLLEYPKRLEKVEKVDEKDLPNVYLMKSTEAKELTKFNPFTVRNGVFDKKDKTLHFSVRDVENTDNLLLSFSTTKSEGILMISLNGYEIFEGTSGQPVHIERNLLQEENTLIFSVSSVGFRFWSTNEYALANVKITADITDLSRQRSQNVFTLTTTEFNNLEKAFLKFIPYCGGITDAGVLEIEVNQYEIFSAAPICDDPYKQVVPLRYLEPGDNHIVFKTNRGSYSVEQIRFEFDVKDVRKKVYYFEINDSNWERIQDGDDVSLEIEFVYGDENKRADLNINGHFTNIDQEERQYSRSIKSWVDEGNNYIEIIPKTLLEIRKLKIFVDED